MRDPPGGVAIVSLEERPTLLHERERAPLNIERGVKERFDFCNGELPPLSIATMDHRNVGLAGGQVFVVGGMLKGQIVSDHVWAAEVSRLIGSR